MLRPIFQTYKKMDIRIQPVSVNSHRMGSKEYNSAKNVYKSSGDIIGERNLMIKYLIEQNEIDFTIYYFSVRLMYLFITATLLLLVFHNADYSLTNNISLAFTYLLYTCI